MPWYTLCLYCHRQKGVDQVLFISLLDMEGAELVECHSQQLGNCLSKKVKCFRSEIDMDNEVKSEAYFLFRFHSGLWSRA